MGRVWDSFLESIPETMGWRDIGVRQQNIWEQLARDAAYRWVSRKAADADENARKRKKKQKANEERRKRRGGRYSGREDGREGGWAPRTCCTTRERQDGLTVTDEEGG